MLLVSNSLAHGQTKQINQRTPVSRYHVTDASEPRLAQAEVIKKVREKIKYVFILYQENRSFDSYFGTFPGADWLFSRKAEQTPGFYQELINTDGTLTKIHPFRIGPREYA